MLSASLGNDPKKSQILQLNRPTEMSRGRKDGTCSAECSRPLTVGSPEDRDLRDKCSPDAFWEEVQQRKEETGGNNVRRSLPPWQPFPLLPAGVRLASVPACCVCLLITTRDEQWRPAFLSGSRHVTTLHPTQEGGGVAVLPGTPHLPVKVQEGKRRRRRCLAQ